MIDFDALDKLGSSAQMLRAIFQAPAPGEALQGDVKRAHDAHIKRHGDKAMSEMEFRNRLRKSRDAWENRMSGRIEEGRLRNFMNYRWHYAADLAWDGPAFKEQVPLMLYAQGKIDIQQTAHQLEKAVGKDQAEGFIDHSKDGSIQSINVTKLGESVINLVRPYLTRRKAALSNKFNALYPWLKYEPRAKTMPDKIKAEVLTQRIEMVSDMMGFRHDFTQWVHRMLLHSGQWVFVAHPWVKEKAMVTAGGQMNTVVTKEGPRLACPHPTRIFYDTAYAPATINTDNGLTYCGYWDILRYRDVRDNPSYFNSESVRYQSGYSTLFDKYRDFFQAYYAGDVKTLKWVPVRNDALDSMGNERQSQSGYLNHSDCDTAVYFTHYYERVIPKDVGWGEYPYPVWVKLTCANDKTVVRVRVLPSRPAFYMGHNEDDSRLINASMAHEILPYQDQAQSLLSQLYYLMRLEQLLICTINVDSINDMDMRRQIKDYLKGTKTRFEAFYLEWSPNLERKRQGREADAPIKFHASSVRAQIATVLEGIAKTLELLDRNLMMSPQELGQFVQRETSATENMIVEKTSNALYSYNAQGPDEARSALKVILYDSFMALGEDGVRTPVTASFPKAHVKAAGFEFYGEQDDSTSAEQAAAGEVEARTVLGNKTSMAFAFTYNSRDGSERTVSVEAAKTLYQFVNQILANDNIMRLFGWKQVAEMISEVFRLSGSIYTIQLPDTLPEGGPGPSQDTPQAQQLITEVRQQFSELGKSLQDDVGSNAERITDLENKLTQALKTLGAVA